MGQSQVFLSAQNTGTVTSSIGALTFTFLFTSPK